jgi:hypothetical protein
MPRRVGIARKTKYEQAPVNRTTVRFHAKLMTDGKRRLAERILRQALARAEFHQNEDQLLTAGCLGHLPEITDGDAPHTPRGCDAQAWSVTEVLRVWMALQPKCPETSQSPANSFR